MMHIHTVAAGGGSILHFDGARFTVGPDSAGANPGPTCYRRGGPLTVTDCNVMLNKLIPEFFPKVFGPNGDEPLDRSIVVEKFRCLANQITNINDETMAPEEVAEGYLTIAVENILGNLREIDYRSIPAATFTHPEISSVGLSEVEAKELSEKETFDLGIVRCQFKANF